MEKVLIDLPLGGFFDGILLCTFRRLDGTKCCIVEHPGGQWMVAEESKVRRVCTVLPFINSKRNHQAT